MRVRRHSLNPPGGVFKRRGETAPTAPPLCRSMSHQLGHRDLNRDLASWNCALCFASVVGGGGGAQLTICRWSAQSILCVSHFWTGQIGQKEEESTCPNPPSTPPHDKQSRSHQRPAAG